MQNDVINYSLKLYYNCYFENLQIYCKNTFNDLNNNKIKYWYASSTPHVSPVIIPNNNNHHLHTTAFSFQNINDIIIVPLHVTEGSPQGHQRKKTTTIIYTGERKKQLH